MNAAGLGAGRQDNALRGMTKGSMWSLSFLAGAPGVNDCLNLTWDGDAENRGNG